MQMACTSMFSLYVLVVSYFLVLCAHCTPDSKIENTIELVTRCIIDEACRFSRLIDEILLFLMHVL